MKPENILKKLSELKQENIELEESINKDDVRITELKTQRQYKRDKKFKNLIKIMELIPNGKTN